jgi:ankyrin repeat protein
MNESTHSNSNSNATTTVNDLATDVGKCKAWLATKDGHTNIAKIINVFVKAIHAGRADICELILDSERLSNSEIGSLSTDAIDAACFSGHLSVAQLIVSRCRPSTQHLYTALANASALGHVDIVTWLLSEMKLSHDKRVRWLLATASACGDIKAVRLLAAQAGITATEVMSQALRAACYIGNVKVVDWLTTYTAADVSLCGELGVGIGSMTSLTAACHDGHVDIVLTLLQCVTPHTVNIQCGKCMDSALHFVIYSINYKNWKHSLHSACNRANISDVTIAVYGVDINMTDHTGSTPLHWACQSDTLDIVQLLLSVFARVDITDDDKRAPLEVANEFGNKDLVPYMSQLLDASKYTPSSSTGANVSSTSSVTRPTVDVIISDVSIVVSDVRSTVQLCAQRDAANPRQQQRQSLNVATGNHKTRFKIV